MGELLLPIDYQILVCLGQFFVDHPAFHYQKVVGLGQSRVGHVSTVRAERRRGRFGNWGSHPITFLLQSVDDHHKFQSLLSPIGQSPTVRTESYGAFSDAVIRLLLFSIDNNKLPMRTECCGIG